jgi:purine-cytosine permease-like protein
MIVKGKLLTGPILALLGGIIMLIAAFIGYRSIAILEEDLSTYMGRCRF